MRRKLGLAIVLACLMAVIMGCSQGAAQEPEPAAKPTATVFEFTLDSNCATCHGVQSDSMDDPACYGFVHKEVACSTCHADEAKLVAVHEGATPSAAKDLGKLKATSVADAVCQTCHNIGDLAVATATSTVLTDTKGTVVNPHALPSTHLGSSVHCADCHPMHSGGDLNSRAQGFCVGCHHEEVYECHTCH